MKFVYMRSTSSLAVLNMVRKHDLHQLKQIHVFSFDQQLISAKNGLETRRSPSDENCLMALKSRSSLYRNMT